MTDITIDELRGVFLDALAAWELWDGGEPEPEVECGGHLVTLSAAFRLLVDNTDLMPNHVADQVQDLLEDEELEAVTYGLAAMRFTGLIADQLSGVA